MRKGEIYAPYWRNKDCKHYIVCMENCTDYAEYIKVCLITHMKTTMKNEIQNQQMAVTWFEPKNKATRKKYKIQYDDSKLICQPILKAQYKINMRRGVVGMLSIFGIQECEKYTREIKPIYSNKPINKEHPQKKSKSL